MRWTSLDTVVRSLLLKEGKPIHYYLQYLAHSCAAIQRLNTTTLKNINSKKIPVNDYKAITLPCDYVDYVMVGFAIGERVRPMILDTSLNRLNNYDDDGVTKIPYELELPDGEAAYDLASSDSLNDTLSDNKFNHDLSRDDYKFNVFPERNEIQLSASFPYDYVILNYITDGLEADNATMVDPLAQASIEKYIMWQNLVAKRNVSEGEKFAAEKRFNDEWRLLRAARNTLTKADIIASLRYSYSGTYKN